MEDGLATTVVVTRLVAFTIEVTAISRPQGFKSVYFDCSLLHQYSILSKTLQSELTIIHVLRHPFGEHGEHVSRLICFIVTKLFALALHCPSSTPPAALENWESPHKGSLSTLLVALFIFVNDRRLKMVHVASLFTSLFILASGAAAAYHMEVHESRDQPPAGFVHSGAAPADHPLKLRIALKQNDSAGLIDSLYSRSSPDSLQYGKHLSKDEVCAESSLRYLLT